MHVETADGKGVENAVWNELAVRYYDSEIEFGFRHLKVVYRDRKVSRNVVLFGKFRYRILKISRRICHERYVVLCK